MTKPLDTTRTARGLVAMAGGNPGRYAPGSLHIHPGGVMDWDERCAARCKHTDGICHAARSGLVPTGPVDQPQETPSP